MTQKDTISTILMCLVYDTNGDILPFDVIVKRLHKWIKHTGYIPSERGGLYNKQYIQTFECGGRKDLNVILTYSDIDSVMVSRVEDVIKDVLQNLNTPTCGEPAENKKEPPTKILDLPVYQYMAKLSREELRAGIFKKKDLHIIKVPTNILYHDT